MREDLTAHELIGEWPLPPPIDRWHAVVAAHARFTRRGGITSASGSPSVRPATSQECSTAISRRRPRSSLWHRLLRAGVRVWKITSGGLPATREAPQRANVA